MHCTKTSLLHFENVEALFLFLDDTGGLTLLPAVGIVTDELQLHFGLQSCPVIIPVAFVPLLETLSKGPASENKFHSLNTTQTS